MADRISGFIVARQSSYDEVSYYKIRQARDLLNPQYIYMSNSIVPETDIHITSRYIAKIPPGFKSEDELQRHNVSQLYTIFGNLTPELLLEDEKREINEPAAVSIPAGKNARNPSVQQKRLFYTSNKLRETRIIKFPLG
jgi:hypothetical protein